MKWNNNDGSDSALFLYIVLYYNFVGNKEDWWEIKLAYGRIEKVGYSVNLILL